MRTLLAFSTAAAFAVGPSSAEAQLIVPSGTYTGGSSFAASFTGSLTYSAGLLTLTLSNNGPGVFSAVGLVNYPGMNIGPGIAPTDWTWNSTRQFRGAGLPNGTWAWIAPAPRSQSGIQPGGSSTFTFNVGSATYQELANVGFGVHAISGPNGCSTKLAVWNGGRSSNDRGPQGYDPSCVKVSVPEPLSGGLLATGILGLAFASRRRQSVTDESGEELDV